MEEKLKFELTDSEVNVIVDALLQMQAGKVFHVLVELKRQISAQTDKYEKQEQ